MDSKVYASSNVISYICLYTIDCHYCNCDVFHLIAPNERQTGSQKSVLPLYDMS